MNFDPINYAKNKFPSAGNVSKMKFKQFDPISNLSKN